MNLYDGCVANKIIFNKQCTISWSLDDLKISHEDEKVVINVIEERNKRLRDIMPLSINRGKIHNFLGMTFDCTTACELIITMYDYIEGLIKNT